MGDQKFAARGEEEKPKVVIPRLSVAEVKRRADRAFDASIAEVIRLNFSKKPSAKEMRELNDYASASGLSNLGLILDNFSEEYPDSTITRYFEATNSTNWILDEKSGKIRFSAKILKKEISEYLSAYKNPVIKICADLADPSNRGYNQELGDLEEALPGIPAQLQAALHRQFSGKKNKLPIAVDYDSDSTVLAFNNLQPPPTQYIKIKG